MRIARLDSTKSASSRGLCLTDLPDEIVAYVFQFIDDTRDLIECACVSWQFKDLSEPRLYKYVKVLEERQAIGLSIAIKRKDVRAKWIQSFLLSPSLGQHDSLKDLPSNIGKMRNLKYLRLETPDLNRQQPRARIPWTSLQERYERIFEYSSLLVPHPRDRVLPFLTECTIHFVDSHTELYGLSKYSALFLHPNLRSLTISCASSDLPHELFSTIEDDSPLQRQTKLENLHLEECDLDAGTLAKILRYPKALKRFTLSEGVRYTIMNSFSKRRHGDMGPDDLVYALMEQVQSLEYLSLSLGYVRPRLFTINDHGQQLDLRAFSRLQTLELCHRTLHLIRSAPQCEHGLRRRLPSSLTKLVVFEIPMGHVRRALRMHMDRAYMPFEPCVFQKKACSLPSLQQLVLKYTVYGQADIDISDAEDDSNSSQIAKVRNDLKVQARSYMASLKESSMSLQIDQVNLPSGYIPPYLAKENKPRETNLWDSTKEP